MASCSGSAGLMKEIKGLMRKPLEDIEIVIKNDNLSILTAFIVGPEGTPFENGRFQIELHFSDSYPQQPPKGYFKTKIWHPNVALSGGDICVNTLKRDWDEKLGVRHILIAIRSLMIVPNYDSALNEEAGRQILENFDQYVRKGRLMTKIHAEPYTRKKKALQNDNDCNNRKNKTGDKENQHSELKENDPSKSNEFTNAEYNAMLQKGVHSNSGKRMESTEAKGKENDERNAKKKHKSKSKGKGKKSKGKKSKISKSMGRY